MDAIATISLAFDFRIDFADHFQSLTSNPSFVRHYGDSESATSAFWKIVPVDLPVQPTRKQVFLTSQNDSAIRYLMEEG